MLCLKFLELKIKHNKSILLLIFFIFLFSLKLAADCPPNWNQGSVTFQIGNCLYFANFCYNCGITGPDPNTVKITKYGKLPNQPDCNDSNITIEEVADSMNYHIRQYFYDNCIIPPCSVNLSKNMIVEYPLCHTYHNRVFIDSNGKLRHWGWWESCNTEFYCQRVKRCCYLGNGELSCVTTSIQTYGQPIFCTPTGSPPQKPNLPPEGYSWYEDWDTDCYYDTSCE